MLSNDGVNTWLHNFLTAQEENRGLTTSAYDLYELTITRLQHSSTKHLCRLSYIPRLLWHTQRRARCAKPDSASRELATAVCLAGLLGWLAHMLSVQSSMVFLEISTPLLLPMALPPHNAVHTVGFCRFSPPIEKIGSIGFHLASFAKNVFIAEN